jgi:hypothetical protein
MDMRPADQNQQSGNQSLSTVMRYGTKIVIGLSLMIAGAALAQNVGFGPQPKAVDETVVAAPTQADLNQAPAPGSQREAKACSDDIKVYCAPQTATRRDVLQCFEDKASLISQSCKAYLERTAEEDAE